MHAIFFGSRHGINLFATTNVVFYCFAAFRDKIASFYIIATVIALAWLTRPLLGSERRFCVPALYPGLETCH